MSGYFIQIPSGVLNCRDLDLTDKMILGYIATRLNIPDVEWLITKTDVANQLAISKQTAGRKLDSLVAMGVLSLSSVGERGLEKYAVNRDVFHKIFVVAEILSEIQSSKMEPSENQNSKLEQPEFQNGIGQSSKMERRIKNRIELRGENKESDDEWLRNLSTQPCYEGIDVHREYGKMSTWCEVNRKTPSRRRFINWINRAERPIKAQTNQNQPITHMP